ncbi:Ig-like domain-containing protein, partial [Rhodobacteraceae bacterium]|nr:Ig-like domain-containing protein [Paracoccaceae bacterium]
GSSDTSDSSDNITSTTAPTVRVDLTGTGAVSGDTLDILLGGVAFSTPVTKTLNGTDISNNYVDLSVTDGDLGADGAKALTARVTDVAGNVGSIGGSLSITLDTTAPSAPSNVIDLDASSDTGSSTTDNSTSDTTPTVRVSLVGTNAASGDTLELLLDGSSLSSAVTKTLDSTDISNTYVDLTTGAHLGSDGDKVFTAKVTDVAGNIGSAGGSLTVTLDTSAPSAPTIDVLTVSDTGTNTADNISADATPQIRVTFSGAEAATGDTVTLYAGASSVATATLSSTDISNGITLTPSSSIGSDGTYSLTAVITDVAGNVGASSSAISYQLDTSNAAPTASVVAVSSSGFTLLASDGDVQPDWNVVTLDSGSVTLNSSALNNGSNTTFTIGEQSVLSSNELFVNDGVASAVAVTNGGTAVKLNGGTEFNDSIGGTDNKVNITYGFSGDDILTGKGEADFLFGGADGDTLRARGGDDTLSGGTGADTFTFESSGNGLDTITDFDDTQSDVLDLDAIITGGLYNSGTAVDATANNAIALASVDNKFVYFEVSDVTSATIDEASLFGGSLDFAAEGTSTIEFVLAVGEGSGTDGVKLYQVNDGSGADDMAITQIALIENNSLADILNANLDIA